MTFKNLKIGYIKYRWSITKSGVESLIFMKSSDKKTLIFFIASILMGAAPACANTEYFRINNLGDFQKAEFAKEIQKNIKSSADLTDEIKTIDFRLCNRKRRLRREIRLNVRAPYIRKTACGKNHHRRNGKKQRLISLIHLDILILSEKWKKQSAQPMQLLSLFPEKPVCR